VRSSAESEMDAYEVRGERRDWDARKVFSVTKDELIAFNILRTAASVKY
jgi:hypothetical protein